MPSRPIGKMIPMGEDSTAAILGPGMPGAKNFPVHDPLTGAFCNWRDLGNSIVPKRDVQ